MTALHDLRYGLRLLARNRGVTSVTVIALSLGIGVTAAAFTGLKALVTRPLDAQNPSEMVNLALKRSAGPPQFSFSHRDYETMRDSLRCFNGVIAFRPAQLVFSETRETTNRRAPTAGSALGRLGLLRQNIGSAEFATVFIVSENYFSVLGTKLLEGQLGSTVLNPPILISENYWQKRYGRDPGIIGRTIYMNGTAVTISGITPHDFTGTGIGAPAFWLPISAEPLIRRDPRWLSNPENESYRLFGRLAPGVSIHQAQAQMDAVADSLRALHDPRSKWANPAKAMVWRGSPFPLPISEYRGLTLTALLVIIAAGMVLLVACANVGSLQLARSRSREAEFKIRASLGAGRIRLMRQLIAESAAVGLLAGGLALLVNWALLKAGVVMMANAFPGEYGGLVFDVTPDFTIFAFVFAVSLLAGLLSGLLPALESSKSGLLSSARTGTSPDRTRRMQDALIVAQVALSLVLMIAGSMAIRSSIRAVTVDTGYETKRVLALRMEFPDSVTCSIPQRRLIIDQLRQHLATVPGISSITSAQPPGDNGRRTIAAVIGASQQRAETILHYSLVERNYFATLSIPLIRGRGLTDEDQRVVVLSESAAAELWPQQDPIGRLLRFGPTDGRSQDLRDLAADGPAYAVIGVARDTRAVDFNASDSKRAYLPLPDEQAHLYPLLVRTSAPEPSHLLASLDTLITSIDPNVPATCATLEELQRQSGPFIVSSLTAIVASCIGLVGLFLALLGIQGTVSYIVVRRTREVGIRMAIGAQRADVLRLILRDSARPILAGLFAGSVLAGSLAHMGRGLLYGLDRIDWISLGVNAPLFLIIGLLASLHPALRATRIDPQVALRYE